MNADQLRMARAGLGLNANDIAAMAGVGRNTINNIENGRHGDGGKRGPTLRKIRDCLEEYVIFVDPRPGEHGVGVILKEGSTVPEIKRNGFHASTDESEEMMSASWEQGWEDHVDIGIEVSVRFGS